MIEESKRAVRFPAMRIRQPIGEFYIGKMSAHDLVEVSWFDIRKLEGDSDLDSYIGIQRKIDEGRIKEIARYVNFPDATFPTAVVLAVEGRCVEFKSINSPDGDFFEMILKNQPGNLDDDETTLFRGIAKVLDGQHRIKGLKESACNLKEFDINVCVFVDADIADQASIFATVNIAQTKVNKSLVYDLLSYSKSRSPERTCHTVTVALDQSEKSPFHQRIKRLGTSTDGRSGEVLTQATVVGSLLPYVTSDVLRDRGVGKRLGKWSPSESYDQEKLIFRGWFINKEDEQIAKQVMHYFEAVRQRWPGAWSTRDTGKMLARTNGFKAFMNFLRPVYNELKSQDGDFVKMSSFLDVLKEIKMDEDEFNTGNFPSGAPGELDLFRALMAKSRLGGYD